VRAWIAIDDLYLDTVSPKSWERIRYMACEMKTASDQEAGNDWLTVPSYVREGMKDWMADFSDFSEIKSNPPHNSAAQLRSLQSAYTYVVRGHN